MASNVGINPDKFARIFGPKPENARGRYVFDAATGKTLGLHEMTRDRIDAYFKRRDEAKSARVFNMTGDIELGDQSFATRADRSAYMEANGLVDYERVERKPQHDKTAEQALERDLLDVMDTPKEYWPNIARDRLGADADISDIMTPSQSVDDVNADLASEGIDLGQSALEVGND